MADHDHRDNIPSPTHIGLTGQSVKEEADRQNDHHDHDDQQQDAGSFHHAYGSTTTSDAGDHEHDHGFSPEDIHHLLGGVFHAHEDDGECAIGTSSTTSSPHATAKQHPNDPRNYYELHQPQQQQGSVRSHELNRSQELQQQHLQQHQYQYSVAKSVDSTAAAESAAATGCGGAGTSIAGDGGYCSAATTTGGENGNDSCYGGGGNNEDVHAEARAMARTERKRCREKQRRNDVNKQFNDLTSVLREIEEDDPDETRCLPAYSPANRVELISRAVSLLGNLHRGNKKRKSRIADLEQQLEQSKKAGEETAAKLKEAMLAPQQMGNNRVMMMVPMLIGPDGTAHAAGSAMPNNMMPWGMPTATSPYIMPGMPAASSVAPAPMAQTPAASSMSPPTSAGQASDASKHAATSSSAAPTSVNAANATTTTMPMMMPQQMMQMPMSMPHMQAAAMPQISMQMPWMMMPQQQQQQQHLQQQQQQQSMQMPSMMMGMHMPQVPAPAAMQYHPGTAAAGGVGATMAMAPAGQAGNNVNNSNAKQSPSSSPSNQTVSSNLAHCA